ncbi:MAG TPA: lamin tail domain-containing protein [Polyangia bacterium]|nr:lamin tail domain-containing protein [Polyangia bacterium]
MFLVIVAALGCGSNRPATGDVGLTVQVAGVSLKAVSYNMSGPKGFSRTGSLAVNQSATLSAVISSLPVGTGFSIAINATVTDGTMQCAGSATFAVSARATTAVTVPLVCKAAPRTGSVLPNGSLNLCPMVDGVGTNRAEAPVGGAIMLTATAHDPDAAPGPLAYQWTATGGGTLGNATTASIILTCTSPGQGTVTVTISDGDCGDTFQVDVQCTSGPDVRINEVESSGGVPGDWVELFSTGSAAFDISGWKLTDSDDSHIYIVPAKTVLAPGAYLVLEEAQFVFGLGAPDSVRLYDAAGNLIDSYSWTVHATTTYGRCPNGTGPFVTTASSTKGGANDCGTGGTGSGGAGVGGMDGGAGGMDGGAGVFPWPGTDVVVTVDDANTFGPDLSGLNYQPATADQPAVLWAIQNDPSRLYRLLWNGTTWASDPANGWGTGKLIHYADGTGGPDSEGVTKAEWTDNAIYVSTERDNNNGAVSRLSVLRYDTAAAGTELTATNDWNLTADLPAVGPNLGLEAITYIPDSALMAGGFFDEATNAPYNPANYPNHGTGLFFVGLEGNGSIYGYALDHATNAFVRVATLPSGQVSIMDLAYDREVGYLWGYCDNTCGNKATVFRLDENATSPTVGRFQIGRVFDHPATLPDSNFEGITFAPQAECVAGQRAFYWSDDDQLDGHALRRGSIPCGAFF